MSNNTNHNFNTDISENQEPTPDEIRRVLEPLFDKFNQVLQRYGLKNVEVVDFTLMVSSKVVREATESSKTILDEYNEILKETGFSDVYKDLEIIDFTIATSLVQENSFAGMTDERREEIILFVKARIQNDNCASEGLCDKAGGGCRRCTGRAVVDENTD